MLTLEKVTKVFSGNIVALREVSFRLEKGELAFLAGAPRAGKTTLLHLIAAQAVPTQGEIILDGLSSLDKSAERIAIWRRKLGLVSDYPRLVEEMSVFDNVALALRISGHKESRVEPKVRQALVQVGLGIKSRALPRQLSFWERRKVEVARAIVRNPILLLADEPTAGLNGNEAEEIMNLLKRANVCGTAVLISRRESPVCGSKLDGTIRIRKTAKVWSSPAFDSHTWPNSYSSRMSSE